MPVKLGGWVTYVIVNGISMEPGFHRGDLVLVRSESAYEVGDAIIYHDPNLGSYVFHRIVGTELDRFILQGDNNAWLDSYRPTTKEIAGKLWISIPKAGKLIEWVRAPLHMSLTVGLLGSLLMIDLFKKSPKKKQEISPLAGGTTTQAAVLGTAVFFLLFLVVGIYAFIQPLNKPAENFSYEQEGTYYYSATGTPGVYDTDVVRSGEPVFPKLTCFLNVGFTYNLLSDRLQNVSGTYKMTARIIDVQSGWQRTIPLNVETPFTGSSNFTMATLDLCQVESMVQLVEEEAGLRQIAYTLEIITDVSIAGEIEGVQVSDSFSPTLVFNYDKVHFYLDIDEPQIDPLRSSKPGQAGSSTPRQNALSVFGFAIPVWAVRFASLAGFGISGLILAFLGIDMYRTARQDEEAFIQLKYGSMLVDVYEQNLAPSASIIDVASLDDLARLAERHGTMILHMPRNFLQFYFVQTNGLTYRYVVSSGKKGAVAEESAKGQTDSLAEPMENPSPTPEPIAADVEERPLMVGDRMIYTFPPQETVTVEDLPSGVLQTPDPQPSHPEEEMGEVEYVIDTGIIQFTMPYQDSVFLQKIKI